MDERYFSNSELAGIMIDIGYIYDARNNSDLAVKAVKSVEALMGRGSRQSIAAQYIVANSTLVDDDLLKKIKNFGKCRKE
ncbi:MAG: hypothetical protein EOO20_26310, partial [Chryseobacterium sp.]